MEALREVSALMDERPPALAVDPIGRLSEEEVGFLTSNAPDPKTGLRSAIPSAILRPFKRLIVKDPAFQQDYLAQGGPFFSKRLRDVLDLPPGTAQYLPVDTSLCPKPVQDHDYMEVYILAHRRVLDLAKSNPTMTTLDDYGRPCAERIFAVRSLIVEEGAQSDVPLFRDPNDPRLLATDSLAERVLRAGIRGVEFRRILPSGVEQVVKSIS